MADYYPLLSRALEALPDRSPALRKAVYDRARNALLGQLRSLDPPVAEADIDLEAQALDAAIARLETDYGGTPSPKPAAEPQPSPASATPQASKANGGAPAKQEPELAMPAAAPASPTMPAAPAFLPEPPPPAEPPKAPTSSPPVAPQVEPARTKPPPAAVPFVPPPRKAKPDAAEPARAADTAVPATEMPSPTVPPDDVANGRKRPRIDVVPPRAGRSRLLRNIFLGAVLAAVIGAIAVAAFFLRDKPADLPGPETAQPNPSEPQDSKFSDRVGSGDRLQSTRRPPQGGPTATPQPDLTVAQRATLYEENPSDPNGPSTAANGRIIWRLEPLNGEPGQQLQNAVRATIDVPEAGISLAMTIRKNLDATLPASHTIELAFTNSGAGTDRIVQDIGLLQLKDEESTRGSPVAGLPVRVRDNLFLIGLSNLPSDVERNTELLTGKAWIDLGVKFKNGKRGVLTFEKGNAGSQVMQTAFDQWRE